MIRKTRAVFAILFTLAGIFAAETAAVAPTPYPNRPRLMAAPEIPTIAESVPGFNNPAWWGVVAPAGTPKAIVEKLNALLNKIMETPEVIQCFQVNGLETGTSTPRGSATSSALTCTPGAS
jgi:tripartite-type tricarboxylate transporter receptor subunit TctC